VAHWARTIWWWLARPRTLGVRGLVVDDQGRVCIVRHTYMPNWYLPGGGVKRSETLVDAVRRELAEEAGIVMTGGPHGLVGAYSNHRGHKRDVIVIFEVTDWKQAGHASPEIAEIRFVAPADLPAEASPSTRLRIAEWAEGRLPTWEWED
jgi:8-oxo-dGTP pyrophosphatase MutT (NUDIX family)